ncbi:hypothetical protein J4H86_22420 [Spiractinospora alimapuensis]|uniref:hypothetical protein n=1 Tax=Spiractinospora alimapuensis TaxID=2820884 RepID=UPI001F2A8824|nr:hypothetical protein [Spiractinospora alimapuensis]QVQ51520.1 hypothetical protein J4H86_22420 [Spiractinospora alimapuensis]
MTADDRFIKECGHPRPGWHPVKGPDHLGCVMPEFHHGPHRSVSGFSWPQDPKLPNVGHLLYGVVSEDQWRGIAGLEGVFRLPGTAITLVSPTGLLRIMSSCTAPTRWHGGRMELTLNDELVHLWPL